MKDAAPRKRVLLADDDAMLRKAFVRILRDAGYEVESAENGADAAALIQKSPFDAIVSDISMPGMDGLALLRAVREHDLDVPVVLMTGKPAIDSAVHALEYGALRYLVKPVEPQVLLQVVAQAVRLHEIAKLKRQALALLNLEGHPPGDLGGLEASFARALKSLRIFYQPLVSYEGREIVAFEALMRSAEPALPTPGAILDAAERLGRLEELGRAIRRYVASTALEAPAKSIFVNLHAYDLLDETLFDPSAPLSRIADRIVLEITERAALDRVEDVRRRIERLRDLGYRVAIDDLGAGYAGLTSFALLEPNVVKIDMSIVRDVHLHEIKQKVVRAIAQLSSEVGMMVVAEGVEKTEERDELLRCGCDVLQGYLFARPGPPFPEVTW